MFRVSLASGIPFASVVFAYYHRLSPAQKRIYRRSDRIETITLPRAGGLQALVTELARTLDKGSRPGVEVLSQKIADGVTHQLRVPRVRVQVLAVRPHDDHGELHGLYIPPKGAQPANLRLWMRTARHKRVVAFRTFLRTLLHELCHHLDYELLDLPDSFHTQGFYKRLTSLFHQLVPHDARA